MMKADAVKRIRQPFRPERVKPRAESGAALVIVIAVTTLLFAIGVTFFSTTQIGFKSSTNVQNTIRAELLADGAVAIAQATLKQDLRDHPTTTSSDHAWRTYFNGAWVAGKQWAFRPGRDGNKLSWWERINNQTLDKSDPAIAMPYVRYDLLVSARRDWWENLPDAQQISVDRDFSRTDLYIPRIQRWSMGMSPADQLREAWDFNVAANPEQRGDFTTDPNRFVLNNGEYGFYTVNQATALNLPLAGAGFAAEQVDRWADVDLDGDGLKDSVWIPLVADKPFSGGIAIDLNGDARDDVTGEVMPNDAYNDGVDNDLDGMVDEAPDNGRDDDGDGNMDELTTDPRNLEDKSEAQETGLFVYWGGNDELDNNGDGIVDDAAEQKLYLTTPLCGMRIGLDQDGDGQPDMTRVDRDPWDPQYPELRKPDMHADGTEIWEPVTVTLPNSIQVTRPNAAGVNVTYTLTNLDVDALDNDYNLITNDYAFYAYYPMITGAEPPNAPTGGLNYHGYPEINPNYFTGQTFVVEPASTVAIDYDQANRRFVSRVFYPERIRITSTGEPVCDLIGRTTIMITDEASRVNLNVAGGLTYRDDWNPAVDPQGPALERANGQYRTLLNYGSFRMASLDSRAPGGLAYDTRLLPGFGEELSTSAWSLLMGAPQGYSLDDFLNPTAAPTLSAKSWFTQVHDNYRFDATLPGYGRVDDNGNALWMAMNGLDDDGDGLVDEGMYLPSRDDPSYPDYLLRLGKFEGIDEPGEYQAFRPLRNEIANADNVSALSNEEDFGDMGDRVLRTRGESKRTLTQRIDTTTAPVEVKAELKESLDTVFSSLTTLYSDSREVRRHVRSEGRELPGPNQTATAVCLDPNYASPTTLASMLQTDWDFQPSYELPPFLPGTTTGKPYLPAEATYFALGLRTAETSFVIPAHSGWMQLGQTATTNTVDVVIPPDPELQAAQAAVNTVDYRDTNMVRSEMTVEREDTWWKKLRADAKTNNMPADNGIRKIKYTVAGIEKIRINEIMARATRRVEAEMEMTYVPLAAQSPRAYVNGKANINCDPNLFSDYPVTLGNYFPLVYTNPATLKTVTPDFNVVVSTIQDAFRDAGLAIPGVYDPTLAWQIMPLNSLGPGLPPRNPIGDKTFWQTQTHTIAPNPMPGPGMPQLYNVIEFKIQASPKLPPGRYYLTVNTLGMDVMGNVGANTGSFWSIADGKYLPRIQYAMGTQSAADLTPLQKYVAGGAPSFNYLWKMPNGASAAIVGLRDMALPGDVIANPATGNLFLQGPGPGFTVTVPPPGECLYVTFALHDDPIYADYDGNGVIDPFAINYLEFSQEPDHEYVELVNIDDSPDSAPVDLSGWQIQIGYDKRPQNTMEDTTVPGDPNRVIMEIPDKTRIAPGGSILVCMNKYDSYAVPDLDVAAKRPGDLFNNGIGMAAGWLSDLSFDPANPLLDRRLYMMDVSVPQIPLMEVLSPGDPRHPSFNNLFGASAYGIPYFVVEYGSDRMGVNTFDQRNVILNNLDFYTVLAGRAGDLLDFVDRDGDGFGDLDNPDTTLISTLFDGNVNMANNPWPSKAWDRIVEAKVTLPGLPSIPSPEYVNTPDKVAAWVLRGGLFPNAPENDGVDNDGDNVGLDGITRDGVDNDGDAALDLLDGADADAMPDGVDEPNEGIDEGGYSLYRHLLGGVLDPIDYNGPAAATVTDIIGPPGAYGWHMPRYGLWLASSDYYANPLSEYLDQYVLDLRELTLTEIRKATSGAYSYLSAYEDHPEWRAFAEKRFFPGDNVVVTLYEGNAAMGRIVDRVTYSERDLINRATDDVVPCPYFFDFNGDNSNSGDGSWTQDYRNLTFWPDNTMGVDFYRSLERKDPLYNGDLHGVANRWDATDGAYDDWAPATSQFEHAYRRTGSGGYDYQNTAAYPAPESRVNWRLASEIKTSGLFSHAIQGSPLRKNTFARIWENPTYGNEAARQFWAGPNPNISPPDPDVSLGQGAFDRVTRSWLDRPVGAAGELLTAPVFHREIYLGGLNENSHYAAQPGAEGIVDPLTSFPLILPAVQDTRALNRRIFNNQTDADGGKIFKREDSYYADSVQGDDEPRTLVSGVKTVTVAQNPRIRDALMGQGSTTRSLVLTCAQADLTPYHPTSTELIGSSSYAGLFQWREGGATVDPYAWIPVFLFGLPNDVWTAPGQTTNPYGIALPATWNFNIFNTDALEQASPGLFGGMNTAAIAQRWPLAQRTAFYVSCNVNTTVANPSSDSFAWPEVMFRWDANDGLENGIYDAYVVTAEPLDRLFDLELRSAGGEDISDLTDLNRGDLLARLSNDIKKVRDIFEKNNTLTTQPGRNRLFDRLLPSKRQDNSKCAVDITFFSDRNDRLGLEERPTYLAGVATESADSYGEMKRVTPDLDGVIHYKSVVTVKNNVLALRLRNRAAPGVWNRFSRVVLVARRDNPGAINLNTVETRFVDDNKGEGANGEETQSTFNPLYGVPGVLAYLDSRATVDDLLFKLPGVSPWTSDAVGLPDAPPPPRDGENADRILDPPTIINDGSNAESLRNIKDSLYWRAQRIVASRPEWRDGRYYRQTTDLLRDRLTEYRATGDQLSWNRVSPLQAAPLGIYSQNGNWILDSPGFYDSLDLATRMRLNPSLKFEPDREDVDNMAKEVAWRYARMANLVTTRSDVFEILVQSQSGYCSDVNGDGQMNYRDDAEFTITAEKKTRAVYER